jgi:hypothetical protein
VVRAVAPQTEADPVAILTQFLVAYGNLVGRTAHRMVGATAHHTNEFLLLVGPSSKGRKGSSWDFIENLLLPADPDWAATRIQSGMSSGEGLIWHVRDGMSIPGRSAEPDPGVEDKRLLVMEPEFALVLRVLAREGNTLSAVVRSAWDGKPLQTMSKNSPTRATNHHVSVIGHISSCQTSVLPTEIPERQEDSNGNRNDRRLPAETVPSLWAERHLGQDARHALHAVRGLSHQEEKAHEQLEAVYTG